MFSSFPDLLIIFALISVISAAVGVHELNTHNSTIYAIVVAVLSTVGIVLGLILIERILNILVLMCKATAFADHTNQIVMFLICTPSLVLLAFFAADFLSTWGNDRLSAWVSDSSIAWRALIATLVSTAGACVAYFWYLSN